MPDIAKCKGTDCSLKEKCYRFTSKPSYRQSYFYDAPIKNGECDYFYKK